MTTSFKDAMNAVRDWDSFQQLMRILSRYAKSGIWYKR